jgi:UDP-2-acetamido-2,6-beta-L-arabino-hexul-4-ose reductase
VKVAITGGHGFLGWHTACRLLATRGIEPVLLGRDEYADAERFAIALADVDTVMHLAGVNRAASDPEVEQGNLDLASGLATALGERPVHIVYANSVQAGSDNAYGRGKVAAAAVLASLPGTLADVRLPNLFGEHGRPAYNSFVATFAHEVAAGRPPTVSGDRPIALLHAQAAAEALIAAAEHRQEATVEPAAEPRLISDVLGLLETFHDLYSVTGDLPDLTEPFHRDLFNTYRAARWPQGSPIHPKVHADPRGELVEMFRSHGGTGQGYLSSTRPGQTRGDHFHLHKVERFVVVKGDAEIALRRLFSEDVLRFRVSGERPTILDMPTMWVHNIRNVGDDDMMTAFWSDQLLDPRNPDQYPMKVEA